MSISNFRWPSATTVLWSLFGVGLLGWFIYTNYQTPCRRTLHYSIGQFDTQFGESREDFIKAVEMAEKVWEVPTGFNLFTYDPSATFTINLIYDERQQTTNNQQQLEQTITSASGTFEQQKKSYSDKRSEYDRRLSDFKQQVDHYNSIGGAPAEQYSTLKSEQQSLNALAKQLNVMADQIDAQAKELNVQIDSFNSRVGQVFDQAVYVGNAINMYEFQNQNDLILALAHELGHTLNINHVSDPKAIMYYLLRDQNVENPQLMPDDLSALKTACTVKLTPHWPTQ